MSDLLDAATETPGRTLNLRLVTGYVVLAVVWAVAFNVESLPFFPTVVVGGVLTGAFGLWAREACPPGSLPTFRVSGRHAALAVAVALVHFALGHLLFGFGEMLLPAIGETARGVYERTNESALIPRLILSGLLTAPLEEIFWRGGFHPAVRDTTARRWPNVNRTLLAVAVSTVGYTLFHVATFKISLVAAAALGGLFWAFLLERTKSLGATIIAHALWTSLMVLYPVI